MAIAGRVADAQNLVDIMGYKANIYRIANKEPIPSLPLDSVLTYYSIGDTFLILCRSS